MTARAPRPGVDSVLGPAREALEKHGASAHLIDRYRGALELPEQWHVAGRPCDGHRAECWPARKADWAHDAFNHEPSNYALLTAGRRAEGDGRRERHRQYCYRCISMLLRLNLTPTTLRDAVTKLETVALTHPLTFDPPTLTDTLRGWTFGRADQRRLYLQALVVVALDRDYRVPEVLDWLVGWGAPVESRDPVLFLGVDGRPQDRLTRQQAARVAALWPRHPATGLILPRP